MTQSAIHVLVTHAFLRSLARLQLAPSKVGRFAVSPTDVAAAGRAALARARTVRWPGGAAGTDSRRMDPTPHPQPPHGRRAQRGLQSAVTDAVSARSLVRSCRADTRRTVPERERIDSDSVVAPRSPW